MMRAPKSKRGKVILGAVIAVQTASSALAWRDLAQRSDSQVRGRKNLWRVIITINPGNSIAYWVFGRR